MSIRNRWVQIAYCRDIPLREGRVVKVGSRKVAVFNLGDRFLAVENRCPHKGGPLADGMISGASVVCPLHAWKMSLETGKGVSGPSASSCVETFRTRVEDEIVLLELGEMGGQSDADSGRELAQVCLRPNELPTLTDYASTAEA